MKSDPVAIAALIDAIAEAKTSLLLAQQMSATNPRRDIEIGRLSAGVTCIHAIVVRHFNVPNGVPTALLVQITLCERGLQQLQRKS